MKQEISAPVIVVAVVIVLAILGFAAYRTLVPERVSPPPGMKLTPPNYRTGPVQGQ